MLFLKIIGLAILITIAVLVIKQIKPDLALLLGVAGGVLLLFYIIDLLEDAFGLFTMILESTHLDSEMFVILLKIVGVGYITEFSSNICNDAGNSAVASKVLLAGKLVIFILAIPIISSLIEMIVSILP